jgi:hypothetical protein
VSLTVCAGVAVAALAALAPSPAQARPGIDVLAQRGFGDRANSYAWGMQWFKGRLYVGTGRAVQCVENQTVAFYFPFSRAYERFAGPSVRCPANPYDMSLRAEIWRYTPGTGRWEMVYRSPTVPNPRAPGKRVARDIAYRGMVVHRDRRGRRALFISGVTPNEYLPELHRRHPPRLLRTYDGRRFHDISRSFFVRKSDAFGIQRPIGFRGLEVWKGRLFALASTSLTGDGHVFRVDRPFRRRARFRQVTPRNMFVFEMKTYNGWLYIGAGSRETGYSVWKTERVSAPHRFRPVVRGGAGRGPVMTGVLAMQVFRNRLYVSAVSWYCDCPMLPTTELIRIGPDDRWEVVVGRPRVTAGGRAKAPISGLMDGFENIFMTHIWRLAVHRGTLYAGALDWSWLLQNDKTWMKENSGILSSLLAGELGFDMWASCDGRDWSPVTRTSFNGDMYDFGVRTLASGRDGLYVGTANHAFGTRIFRDRIADCDPLVDRTRARAADAGDRSAPGPARLVADVQRNGTVLSWEPSGAGRYQVLRAAYPSVTVAFERPQPLPSGFWLEGQQPRLVPPGTPGAIEADLATQGRFTPIGEITGRFFVDRTRRPGERYAYRVVAAPGTAQAGAGTNVQVVPDPRPAPTFDALERSAPVARSAAAGARERWRRGDRAGALVLLGRLARTAPAEETRDVARRLERRLRYRDVAGGPVAER